MKKKTPQGLKLLLLAILISGLALGGCGGATNSAEDSSKNSTEPTTSTTAEVSSKSMKDYVPRLEGKATVVMKVNGSDITIEVNGDEAPITAGNFVDLVERGVYDGLVFHRVVKDPEPFVVQGGDPQGKDPSVPVSSLGTGGFIDPETSQRRFIPLEIKREGEEEPSYSRALGRQGGISAPKVVLKHTAGAVAMARSGNPDSASSQFYFALADLGFLDGDYAVFGYVTDGMEVVNDIKMGDRIESAKVTQGLENLKK